MAHSEIPIQVILDMLADGQSVRQISKAIGRDESGIRIRIKRAQAAAELPEGVMAAMQASGTAPGVATQGWIKTKGKKPGDTEHSVFWKAPPQQVPDLANALREALTDVPAAPARPTRATAVRGDRLVLLPLPDAHVGMFAWGKESGDSYDVAIAEQQIVAACCDLIDRSGNGAASELILLNLGDFLHAENDNARTPMSQHALDVDGRQYRTMQAAIRITATVIDYARDAFSRVTYRALPGNHDPMGAIAIALAMGQRYRDAADVVVEDNPAPFWFRRFGTTMLGAHHGDGVKPERLVMHMADTQAQDWAATNWRYYFTGHLHHHASREIGGVQWEQLRAIAPKDAWATKHAYIARRSIQAITYDVRQGEVARSSANI